MFSLKKSEVISTRRQENYLFTDIMDNNKPPRRDSRRYFVGKINESAASESF